MKVLSRDFTLKEKILMIALVLMLMALGYYFLIDQPVRDGIASANADYEMYTEELNALQVKIARLDAMQQELDAMKSDKTRMPSYNASRQEINFLNTVLADAQDYTVTFSSVTREGDQIRRSFTLQFTAADFAGARNLLNNLSGGELRCKLGDMSYAVNAAAADGTQAASVTVSVSAVFYETMVDGTADAGLPADSSATGTNTDNTGDTEAASGTGTAQ